MDFQKERHSFKTRRQVQTPDVSFTSEVISLRGYVLSPSEL